MHWLWSLCKIQIETSNLDVCKGPGKMNKSNPDKYGKGRGTNPICFHYFEFYHIQQLMQLMQPASKVPLNVSIIL